MYTKISVHLCPIRSFHYTVAWGWWLTGCYPGALMNKNRFQKHLRACLLVKLYQQMQCFLSTCMLFFYLKPDVISVLKLIFWAKGLTSCRPTSRQWPDRRATSSDTWQVPYGSHETDVWMVFLVNGATPTSAKCKQWIAGKHSKHRSW